MFQHFIYFIVALLIYTTYPHSQTANFGSGYTMALFLASVAFFIQFVRLQFNRLVRRTALSPPYRQEYLHKLLISRLSILSIALFAFDVWGLDLSVYFASLPIFASFPTLLALLFMGLFVFYLAVVWWFAYPVYQRLTGETIKRVDYVRSNIVFAFPILLPFMVISGVTDLILLSPFETFKGLIATPLGQVLYFLSFLMAIAILGPAMIQYFWQCTPLEAGALRERIDRLSERAGVRYRNIMYWPLFGGRMITAGVMGLIQRFRYILITPGLVRNLSSSEIDAVIAHEIGHVRHRHLLLYLLFFIGFFLIISAGEELLPLFLILFAPFRWMITTGGVDQGALFSVVMVITYLTLLFLYFRFIFGYFMRNFERQADAFVYSLFNTAHPLISTFYKIANASAQPADKKNWHHFSIQQRIDFLQACEQDRTLIQKHNAKVRRNLATYLVGLILVAGLLFSFSYGAIGHGFRIASAEKVILWQIERSPHDPTLHSMLGDIYYEQEKYEATAAAYEQSLGFNQHNPQILNNLAWLYATCPDTSLRNPERALALALKAVRLQPEAHILDTLAESYFINGYKDKAIATARQALSMAKEKKHFREQLIRFQSRML